MSARVHPTAVVEPGAVLGARVVVGPFCYVQAGVSVGDGSELVAHVTLLGPAAVGRNNRLFPYCTLGAAPQDRSFGGEETTLSVGDHNVFREQVTVHRGTLKGGGVTRIGSRCLLMVGAHVAHDCKLDDDVVLTNLCTLGGHVEVEASAVCGGLVAVAPFVRIGRASFVAGGSMVERDVPPFVIAGGDRARVRALNRVGLERLKAPAASRRCLKQAFGLLFRSREPLASRLAVVEEKLGADAYVAELLRFLRRRPRERGGPGLHAS